MSQHTIIPEVSNDELDTIRNAMVEREGLIASIFSLLRNAPRYVNLNCCSGSCSYRLQTSGHDPQVERLAASTRYLTGYYPRRGKCFDARSTIKAHSPSQSRIFIIVARFCSYAVHEDDQRILRERRVREGITTDWIVDYVREWYNFHWFYTYVRLLTVR
jgi:aarF domain-containing kinase